MGNDTRIYNWHVLMTPSKHINALFQKTDEVRKLIAAKFIRELYYPDWLANVVMVKKANDKWRMCIDFTDLNKAYPKDSYPLPCIDQLVDSTAGHKLLSFMDAFSGDKDGRGRPREDILCHQSRLVLL